MPPSCPCNSIRSSGRSGARPEHPRSVPRRAISASVGASSGAPQRASAKRKPASARRSSWPKRSRASTGLTSEKALDLATARPILARASNLAPARTDRTSLHVSSVVTVFAAVPGSACARWGFAAGSESASTSATARSCDPQAMPEPRRAVSRRTKRCSPRFGRRRVMVWQRKAAALRSRPLVISAVAYCSAWSPQWSSTDRDVAAVAVCVRL